MTDAVRDGRPPMAVVRVLNPIMRAVLRTPLGRLVKPFALLEFSGRRTGRRYRVPAGWYYAAGVPVVFSPAAWRANFTGGTIVHVRYRGKAEAMTGTLVTDPDEVAQAFRSIFAAGISPRAVGLKVAPGHDITPEDVTAVDRLMIRFQPNPVGASRNR